MFLITHKRWNHHVNDIKTAADFDEVFHGNGFVVQCYDERGINNV